MGRLMIMMMEGMEYEKIIELMLPLITSIYCKISAYYNNIIKIYKNSYSN